MTFTVLGYDPTTGEFGAAIASRFLAVGSYCLYAEFGVGLAVSQSMANPALGDAILRRMRGGEPPERAMAEALVADPHADRRQTLCINARGQVAATTGMTVPPYVDQIVGDKVALAGNTLANPNVLRTMLETFRSLADSALPARLIRALAAGDAAGGDLRGRQSAALLMLEPNRRPGIDLRVDDHTDPCAELARLYDLHIRQPVSDFLETLPVYVGRSKIHYPPMR